MKTFFCTPQQFASICMVFLLVNIPGLWQPATADEQLFLTWSQLPFAQISLTLHQHGQIPPLYPLLLSILQDFTPALWLLRLFSLLLSTALLWWAYRLGCYWRSSIGIWIALLLGICLSLHFQPSLFSPSFAIALNPDILSALLGSMSLYYLWRWVHTRRDDAFYTFELAILLMWVTTPLSLPWLLLCNLVFLSSYWLYGEFFQIMQQRWWLGQAFIMLGGLLWLEGHLQSLTCQTFFLLLGALALCTTCLLIKPNLKTAHNLPEPEKLRLFSLLMIGCIIAAHLIQQQIR